VNSDTASWYTASDQPEPAEFGPVRGLGVTGQGEPGGEEYGICVRALYTVFDALPGAEPVPLEGRWWVEDSRPPLEVERELWRWHLFLRLPDALDPALTDHAREATRPSGAAVDRVQLVTFTEGRCVQLIHHGPYADEPASLARLDRYMAQHGLRWNGLHHEIYLSDVTETDPTKMRTLLRHPCRPA